jgi:hypothetical protein
VWVVPLALGAFAFYRWNLKTLYPLVSLRPDRVYHADSTDVIAAMSVDRITFQGDMQKHLLFAAVVNPPARLLRALGGISARRSILDVLAAAAAANIAAVHAALRARGAGHAALLAVFHGLLFSNLVYFSIPETYVVSNLAIALYANLLIRSKPRMGTGSLAALSAAAGVAALFNPPLLSLAVPAMYVAWRSGRVDGPARLWGAGLGPAVTVFAGTFAAVQGRGAATHFIRYGRRLGTLRNLVTPALALNVALSFAVYAVVAPVRRLSGKLGLAALPGYGQSPVGAVLLVSYVALLGLSVLYVIRTRDDVIRGMLLWALAMMAFHVYFNPTEAILFSSQTTIVITLLAAAVLDRSRLRRGWPGWILIPAWLALLAVHNVGPLYRGLAR